MGIDLIRGGRIANRGFRTTKSSNSYLKSLIKVHSKLCSFIHFCQEELRLNLIKLSTKGSINLDLIAIPSQSQELPGIYLKMPLLLQRELISLPGLSPLLGL